MFPQANVGPGVAYAQLNPYPTMVPAAGSAGGAAAGGAAGGKTLMIIVGVIAAGMVIGMALGLGLGIGAVGILSDQAFINVTNTSSSTNSTR